MDNNQTNNMTQEVQQQAIPVTQQPQMYQQQMPSAPRKKFNWFLWIAVALITPIAIGVILQLIGKSIGGSAETQPIANFVYSLGTLAMWLLTYPSLLIVIIIGVTRGNKN